MKIKCLAAFTILLASACMAPQTHPATLVHPSTVASLPSTHLPLMIPSGCKNIIGPGTLPDSLSKTHIIYQGYNEKGKPFIWSVGMNDGKEVLLENYPGTVSGLSFLQDAKHFLIAIGDGEHAWLGDVDGNPPVKVELTEDLLSNFQPYSPIWSELIGLPIDIVDYRYGRFHSPDNQTIASWDRGDKAFILIDQTSKKEQPVVLTGSQDTISGRWTPDGMWFIFTYTHGSPDDYFSQLLRVSADGTQLEPLTEKIDTSSFVSPVLSPDGKKIIFISRNVKDEFGVYWIENKDFRTYPLDFTIASSYGDSMVWSPDSEWVAYFSEWNDVDIDIFNIITGDTYCVTQDSTRENVMDWR